VLGVADQIAEEYLNRVRVKEGFVSAACPFHKGGQERHPSFWINRETGAWGCFSCDAHGSSLKYLLKEMGEGSKKIEAELEEAEKDSRKTVKLLKAKRRKKARAEFRGVHTLPENLLGVFDFAPVSLMEAGYTEETLLAHDVGFDRRYNRITFPVRDLFGSLVGVSGRATVPGDFPKYRFYNGRRRYEGKDDPGELGEWYPSYSNESVRDHIWGMHEFYEDLFKSTDGQIILVEGFKARMWMKQHGWNHTGAIMGTQMSPTQERIIRRLGAEVFLFADNNEPGHQAAYNWGQRLAVSSFPVYRVNYPEYCDETAQPDDLSDEEIEEVLTKSIRVGGKYVKPRSRMAFKQKSGREKKRGRW